MYSGAVMEWTWQMENSEMFVMFGHISCIFYGFFLKIGFQNEVGSNINCIKNDSIRLGFAIIPNRKQIIIMYSKILKNHLYSSALTHNF